MKRYPWDDGEGEDLDALFPTMKSTPDLMLLLRLSRGSLILLFGGIRLLFALEVQRASRI